MQGQLVGEVELGDVDPPLLRQLDEDPDRRRGDDPEPQGVAGRVTAQPHHLVGDEEVLEGVGEDQQQRAPLGQLERDDAHQPVEVEELRDPERGPAGPVPQRRQVGDRQVVDVHRLVVALVTGWVVTERLEDRLVDPVDHQRRQHGREGEPRDQQRHEEARADHGEEHHGLRRHGRSPAPGHDVDMGPPPRRRLTGVPGPTLAAVAGRGGHPVGVSTVRRKDNDLAPRWSDTPAQLG